MITYQSMLAEWLTHLAATPEVMGSRPSVGNISEMHFLESIQSPTQRDFKWSVQNCRSLLWAVIICIKLSCKANKCQTQQFHARTHLHAQQLVVSNWLGDHQGKPSALTSTLHELHIARCQEMITITIVTMLMVIVHTTNMIIIILAYLF